MSAPLSQPRASGRVEGIDVARGLAGLIMIQGHAYHGWASPEAKETAAYAFTRVLGTLPLPAFLILAGAAVGWRVHAAATRAESAAHVRRRIVLRGLQIVLWGYVVSAIYMLMDGGRGLDTLLRADVLHVIGLSIAGLGFLGIRPRRGEAADAAPDPRRMLASSVAVGLAVTVACPWLTQLSAGTEGPLRYLVGLFADVAGVTLMPVVPLTAWFCVGVGAAQWMLRARAASSDTSPRGAPRGALLGMAGFGLALAVSGTLLTPVLVDALGGTLSRAHPAVWLNAVELAGRGLLILAAGALLAGVLRGATREVFLRMGRGSLVAYVFHIPFCYGALGAPLIGQLDMGTATVAVLALMAVSYGAVVLRDRLRGRFPRLRLRPATARAGR